MSFTVVCTKCHQELTVPGAIVVGPPLAIHEGLYHRKHHLCVDCFEKLLAWFIGLTLPEEGDETT